MRWLLIFLLCSPLFAHEEQIRSVVAERWGKERSEIALQKLGNGLTNENYLLTIDSAKYFVRCSSAQGALLHSSLESEWQACSIAHRAGLAPEALLFDPDTGIMISAFIESGQNKISLREREIGEKFCSLLRTLHSLDVQFQKCFCPFDCIDSYVQSGVEVGAQFPSVLYEVILPQISSYESAWKEGAMQVPCHLDLHDLNLIDDGERLYLIDWEYAAMSDPFFDLATVASANFFSDDEMRLLLTTYLEREPTSAQWKRFVIARILADTRWCLWSYLQDRISSIDFSFDAYGEAFIEQILARVS